MVSSDFRRSALNVDDLPVCDVFLSYKGYTHNGVAVVVVELLLLLL